MVNAIIKDLKIKQQAFPLTQIQSIYFGGGTPSLLSEVQLKAIIQTVKELFNVSAQAEITLEANPDNLAINYLKMLKAQGINRLSIGIQAFQDGILEWMNRSHNSKEAIQCIANAVKVGFKKLTVDLIYGIPHLTDDEWQSNIETILNLPVNHFSAYSLTLEPKTPYAKLVKSKKYLPPDDDQAARHFKMLQMATSNHPEWAQYEISNFAKNNEFAVHNTAYWKGKPYIAVGPSAHGFNGKIRYANVDNNQQYINDVEQYKPYHLAEELTPKERANELIMTGLRLTEGFNLDEIGEMNLLFDHKQHKTIEENIEKGYLLLDDGRLQITKDGMLFADHIASELFFE